jgi:hypothetical protein
MPSPDNIVQIFLSPETLDDWKAYIAEATAMEQRADQSKVKAIVEKGRRIAEFRAAFRAQGQRWGRRWEDLCQEITGVNASRCNKYELVAQNTFLNEKDISFPGDIESLYYLARAVKADRDVVNTAIQTGEVGPKINRHQAEAIMRHAEAKLPPRALPRAKNVVPVWGKHNRPVIIPSKKTLAERRKPQPMLTIPMRDVTERLGPLIKKLKQQSKCHAATVSFTTLAVLATELEHLAEEWTSGGTGI